MTDLDKDREFPLYSKGKDKYHFNYGVFLLNKNISQLRFQCSLSTLDLRQTLQNLLTLMHKLGVVRMDGDASNPPTLNTPEDTTVSHYSNSTGVCQSFQVSTTDDLSHTQASRSAHPVSKMSDFSEDTSSLSAVDNPTARSKEVEEGREVGESYDPTSAAREQGGERKHFDESEEIFKPASDDHFFRVSSISVMEAFNCGDVNVEGDQCPINDHHTDAEMSALIDLASQGESLAPTKSFQLLKPNRTGSKDSDSEDTNSGASQGDNCEFNGCGGGEEADGREHSPHSPADKDSDYQQQGTGTNSENGKAEVYRESSHSTVSHDRSMFDESIKIEGVDRRESSPGAAFS